MPDKKDRKQTVVLSNDAARNANFNLTTIQLKILLYIISKIKPTDDISTWYEFELIDMAKCCGLKIKDSGTYYKRLKQEIRSMAERNWEAVSAEEPDREALMSWLGDSDIKKGTGFIRVRFNPYVEDCLFYLKNNYTLFELENVLSFTSKHSIKLYILLKSYMNLDKPIEFKRETIQIKFSPEKQFYKGIKNIEPVVITDEDRKKLIDEWKNFKPKILEKAKDEINTKSEDMHVEIQYIKGERSHLVEKIRFIITKPGAKQKEIARQQKEIYFQ